MPKRPLRNKQSVRPGAPITAADLIASRLPALAQRARSASETSEWQVAIMKVLGPELANKVNRCTLDNGILTVVTDSPAWAARLRFALSEPELSLPDLVPGFKNLVVRVRPRRPSSRA